MSGVICDFSGLNVMSCAHCRPLPPATRLEASSGAFTAEHPGECVGCFDPIRPGEAIHAVVGGGYAHGRCVR